MDNDGGAAGAGSAVGRVKVLGIVLPSAVALVVVWLGGRQQAARFAEERADRQEARAAAERAERFQWIREARFRAYVEFNAACHDAWYHASYAISARIIVETPATDAVEAAESFRLAVAKVMSTQAHVLTVAPHDVVGEVLDLGREVRELRDAIGQIAPNQPASHEHAVSLLRVFRTSTMALIGRLRLGFVADHDVQPSPPA